MGHVLLSYDFKWSNRDCLGRGMFLPTKSLAYLSARMRMQPLCLVGGSGFNRIGWLVLGFLAV